MEEHSLTTLEHYYEKQETMTRECLLALKTIILSVDKSIVHTRKYQIPFFCYKEFYIAFMWVHRRKIIVGFIEDKKTLHQLTTGRRKDKVITLKINPLEDIPIDIIKYNIETLIRKCNYGQ